MTTEEGLEGIAGARRKIECLRRRREWIKLRIDEGAAVGREVGYERAELAALEWAIPVLEAEWDNLCRIHKNVERVEHRLGSLERNGVEQDLGPAPEWEVA